MTLPPREHTCPLPVPEVLSPGHSAFVRVVHRLCCAPHTEPHRGAETSASLTVRDATVTSGTPQSPGTPALRQEPLLLSRAPPQGLPTGGFPILFSLHVITFRLSSGRTACLHCSPRDTVTSGGRAQVTLVPSPAFSDEEMPEQPSVMSPSSVCSVSEHSLLFTSPAGQRAHSSMPVCSSDPTPLQPSWF